MLLASFLVFASKIALASDFVSLAHAAIAANSSKRIVVKNGNVPGVRVRRCRSPSRIFFPWWNLRIAASTQSSGYGYVENFQCAN